MLWKVLYFMNQIDKVEDIWKYKYQIVCSDVIIGMKLSEKFILTRNLSADLLRMTFIFLFTYWSLPLILSAKFAAGLKRS